MYEVKDITVEEKEECIQRALDSCHGGHVRCSRCREIINLYQNCSKCGRSWESWLKGQVQILRKERKKKEETIIKKKIAEGDPSWLYIDLSEEVEF